MPTEPPSPHSIEEFVQGYERAGELRGFRCAACGRRTVTWGLACSGCGAGPLKESPLAATGRIVAGTLVAVASEEFVNEVPYAYVLVELDGGGRVSGWIPGIRSEEAVAPGTPVVFTPSYKAGVQFRRTEGDASAVPPR